MLMAGTGSSPTPTTTPIAQVYADDRRQPIALTAEARIEAARLSLQEASPSWAGVNAAPAPARPSVGASTGQAAIQQAELAQRCMINAPMIAPEPDVGTLGRLANAAYGHTPPSGWSAASTTELQAIGLTPAMLSSSQSEFRAQVFVDRTATTPNYVVAFKGTTLTSKSDWSANAQQAVGRDTDHFNHALAIGRDLSVPDGVRVTLTGHSLGGGLASAASLTAELPATTFNASGLSDHTKQEAATFAGHDGSVVTPDIRAYYVRGDILSAMQDGGDRVAGSLLGYWAGGPIGGAAGAAALDLPEAVGTRIGLNPVKPEGAHFWNMHPVNFHTMDYVQAAVDGR